MAFAPFYATGFVFKDGGWAYFSGFKVLRLVKCLLGRLPAAQRRQNPLTALVFLLRAHRGSGVFLNRHAVCERLIVQDLRIDHGLAGALLI